jgi:hypothetical protein
MQYQDNNNDRPVTVKDVGHWLMLIAPAYATACLFSLGMRWGSGKNYTGREGLLGLVAILVGVALTGAMEVGFLLIPYCLSLLFQHRLVQAWRGWRGVIEHTRYNGAPWMAMRLFRHRDELKAKRVHEPFLVFIFGLLLAAVSPPVGLFIALGMFACGLTNGMIEARDQRRVDDLNDAMIESADLAGRYRSQRRG